MKYTNSIEYNISTKFDNKGLTQLKNELQGLELKLQKMGNEGLLDEKAYSDARDQIRGLGEALTEAFNPSLGMIDLNKFNTQLKLNGVNALELKTAFGQMGAEGQVAFNNLVRELGKLDTGIVRTSSAISKIATTFQNTFRWGIISSFFSQFMNAIHGSIEYAKELDESLTQIMLVTDYNRDAMNEYAKAANEAAKAVGQTTVGMTNASLIFAQQGYDLNQSQELATLSAKLANASQQDTAATSDQITAYMNAYGLSDNLEELTQAMDNWALIANISAADVQEIAVAAEKAASMANNVGVSGEALAAQIATIESVTRDAPEQIGNGLKTLYARFSDLQLGKKDEEGVSLGDVTAKLEKIGVQVLDNMGNVRTMDAIMEDLMVVWNDLDETTKTAAAQALAGKYQVNRFVALMDNSDMYQEYKGATGEAAAGTLEQMNTEYLDSLSGRLTKLQASLEGLFNDVFTTDAVYPLIDALTELVHVFDSLFKGVGGGANVLRGFVTLILQLSSKDLAAQITSAATNKQIQQLKIENAKNAPATLATLGYANPNSNDQNAQNILSFNQFMQSNAQYFNADQINQANQIFDNIVDSSNKATLATETLQTNLSKVGTIITAVTGDAGNLPPFLHEGAVNASELMKYLQGSSEAQIKQDFSDLNLKLADSKEALGNFNQALQDYQQRLREAADSGKPFKLNTDELKIALQGLTNKIDTTTFERYKKKIEEISKAQEKGGDATAQLTGETGQLIQELRDLNSIDLKTISSLDTDAYNAKILQDAADGHAKIGEAMKDGIASQKKVQTIIKVGSAISQVAFAVNSLKNIGSIWNDKDISFGEKLLQIITALAVTGPSAASAISSIILATTGAGSLKELGSILAPGDKIKEIDQAMEAYSNVTKAKEQSKIASWNLETAEYREIIAMEATESARDKQKISTKQITEAQKKLTQITELETEAQAEEAIFVEETAEAERELAAGKTALDDATIELTAALEAQNKANTRTTVATEAEAKAEKNLAEAKAAQAKNSVIITNQQELENAQTERSILLKQRAAAATKLLVGAIAIAALVLIAAKIADISNHIKELNENVKKSKEEFEKAYGKTQVDTSKFDELYEKYKETGKVTDELKQASETLGEQLDITAYKARLAAGDFNGLAKSIHEASEESYGMAEQAANNFFSDITAATTYSPLEDLFDIDSTIGTIFGPSDPLQAAKQAGVHEYFKDIEQKAKEKGTEASMVVPYLQDEWLNLDADEQYNQLMQYLDYIQEQRSKLQDYEKSEEFSLLSPTEQGNIQAAIEDWTAEINIVENALSTTYEGLSETLENMAAAQIAELSENEFVGEYPQTMVETLLNTEGDYSWIAKQYRTLAETSTQEAANAFLTAIMKKIDPKNNQLYDFIMGDFSSLQTGEEVVIDASGWDDEFLAQFGTDKAEVFKTIKQELSEPIVVPLNIQTEYDFDSDEEIKDYLENYTDIDRETLDLAAELRSEVAQANVGNGDRRNGYEDWAALQVQQAEETLAAMPDTDQMLAQANFNIEAARTGTQEQQMAAIKELDEAKEAAQKATEAEEDLVEAQEHLNEAQENGQKDAEAYQKALQRAAAAQARMVKTIKEMNDHFKDNKEILQEGNKTSIEYAEALKQTKEDAAGLLNIDAGSLSNDFFETTDALEKMNTILTGTDAEAEAAYQELQKLASSDIIEGISKNVDGNLVNIPVGFTDSEGNEITDPSEYVKYTLEELIGHLNEMKEAGQLGIDVESDINTAGWYERVNELLASGAITADQLTQALSAAGYVGEIVTHKGKGSVMSTTYMVEKLDPAPLTYEDAEGEHTNWVDQWRVIPKTEMIQMDNIEIPVLVGATQTEGVTYARQAANRGSTPKSSSGSGGGGGGSKSSGSKKEKKEHKKDYYEEVDNQLSKVQSQLDGIQQSSDRLIGKEAQANQQKQIELLKKEIELQQKKLKILKEEELVDLYKETNQIWQGFQNYNIPIPKFKVDEDGIISNYEEVSKALDDAYNYIIDHYAASETRDAYLEGIEKWGQAYLDNGKRWNEAQGEIVDLNNTIEQLKDSVEDLGIEMVNDIIDSLDRVAELNEKFAELSGFLTGLATDSPFRQLTRDLTEFTKDFGENFTDGNLIDEGSLFADTKASIEYFVKTAQEGAATGIYGEFGENTAAFREAAERAWDQAFENAQKFQELAESIGEDIISVHDEVAEKQERQISKYERLADQVERLSDAYSLVYGEDSYRTLSELAQKQGNVIASQVNAQQEYYNILKNLYMDDNGWNETFKNLPEATRNAIEDQMNEILDSIQENAMEAAEKWADAYEKAIQASTQDIIQSIIKDNNFDRLDRNWEWDTKYMDKYRDSVEKAYEIEKLRGNYNSLLNKAQTASLQTQNKIRTQMNEQLKYLEEQKTVSEYDVKLANSKLLLLEKQIALEDAQRNKNQMQLRRDSQGNYRYVYRASQDEVEKARQELLDAEQDLYKTTKDQARKNYEDLISYYKDYLNDREEILRNHGGNAAAAADDLDTLTKKFQQLVEGVAEDSNDTAAGLLDILGTMAETGVNETAQAAQDMLNQVLNEQNKFRNDSGVIWVDLFDFIGDVTDKTTTKVNNTIEQANKNIIGDSGTEGSLNWLLNKLVGSGSEEEPAGILGKIDQSFINEEVTITNSIDNVQTSIKGLETEAEKLRKSFNDVFNSETFTDAKTLVGNVQKALETLTDWMKTNMIPYIEAIEATYDKITAHNYVTPEEPAEEETPIENAPIEENTATQEIGVGSKVSYRGASYNWSKKYNTWYEATQVDGNNFRYRKSANEWSDWIDATGGSLEITKTWVDDDGTVWYQLGEKWGWIKADQITGSYDTGGYTGQWNGKDGRLALIHQKELILNAEDTKNVLAAVDIVRGITSTLGNALSTVSANRLNATSAFSGETIEQRVEIKAEFPNVRDSIEIENALINLADTAYQYAHRNI